MSNLYKLINIASLNTTSLVIRAALGIVLSGYLARVLTPDEFGLAVFFIVAVQLSSGLSELGMRTSLVAIVTPFSKSKDETYYSLLRTGVVLRLKISIYALLIMLCFIVVVQLQDYYEVSSIFLLAYGAVVGSLVTLANYPLAIYRINAQFNRYSLTQLALPLIRLALLWLAVLALGARVDIIVAVFFVSVLAYGFIVGRVIPWGKVFSSNNPEHDVRKRLINLNGWLGAAYLIESIAVKLDVFMIKSLMSSIDLGLYYAAYQFVSFLFLLGSGFTFVLLPKLTNKKFEDKKNLATPFIFSSALLLAGISSSFVFIFSPEVIWLVFGEQYASSSEVLKVLVFAGFFGLLQAGSGQLILRYYSSKYLIQIALANLAINFVLNIVFIPIYGLYGAAISTVVAYCFICFYSWGVCFVGARKEGLKKEGLSVLIRSLLIVTFLFFIFVVLHLIKVDLSLAEKIIYYVSLVVVLSYLTSIRKVYIEGFRQLRS